MFRQLRRPRQVKISIEFLLAQLHLNGLQVEREREEEREKERGRERDLIEKMRSFLHSPPEWSPGREREREREREGSFF